MRGGTGGQGRGRFFALVWLPLLLLLGQPFAATAQHAGLPVGEVIALAAPSVVRLSVGRDPREPQRGPSAVMTEVGLVTAARFVPERGQVEVVLPDGQRAPASVERWDSVADLALLRTDAALPPLALEPALGQRRADTLLFMDYPHADPTAPVAVSGVVSSVMQDRTGVVYLETDASVNAGMEGGAVLDRHGRLVGIAVGTYQTNDLLAFAVGAETVRAFATGAPIAAPSSPERPSPWVQRLDLPTNARLYDPSTLRLYASVPAAAGEPRGNTLTWIDPDTATIGDSIPIGREPNRLLLDYDAFRLFVGLDGEGAVRAYTLEDDVVGPLLPLGTDQAGRPYTARALAVYQERWSGDLVVVRAAAGAAATGGAPTSAAVYLYGDARLLPATIEGLDGPLGFVDDRRCLNTVLWAIKRVGTTARLTYVIRTSVGLQPAELEGRSDIPLPGAPTQVVYDDPLLYLSTGEVVDLDRGTVERPFGITATAVAMNSQSRTIYFLTGQGSTRTVQAFDRWEFRRRWSLDVHGVVGEPGNLVYWGQDGLAFRTSGGQVFIIPQPLRWEP